MCELSCSEMIVLVLAWKLGASRCNSLKESAVLLIASQHKPQRIGLPAGMLSFLFPLPVADAHSSITLADFLVIPHSHPSLEIPQFVTLCTCILQLCLHFSKKK